MSPETVKELIQSFVKLRVLRDKDDNGRYELRHDALAEKVYEKFSTTEKELLEIRQFIENAYQSYLRRKILLSNDDLVYISNKDSLLNLNDDLKAFLDESRKLQKARIRTVRRLTVISAIAFVILVCTLGYYVITRLSWVNANYLAVNSINQTSDPLSRLKMAADAWEKNPGFLPREALLKAFNDLLNSPDEDSASMKIAEQYKLEFDPAPVNIKYAECSKDNKYIFGYGDSLIMVWTMTGNLELVIKTDHFPIMDIKMSGNSWYIGAVSRDSILSIWDILGKPAFSCNILYNDLNTRQMFKFTKENNILALSKEHDAVLYDTDGRIIQTFDMHTDRVTSVDVSSDYRFLATASLDSTIIIWQLEKDNKSYIQYKTLKNTEEIRSISFSPNNIALVTNSAVVRTIEGWTIFYGVDTEDFSGSNSIYAEFSASDYGIIVFSLDSSENGIVCSAINFNSPVRHIRIKGDSHYPDPEKFDYLAFSDDDNYFVYTRNSRSYLADNRYNLALSIGLYKYHNTLLNLEGTNPFFTTDNMYILSLKGNTIIPIFIDINTICGSLKGD
jgi:WD40 repeat protein